MFDRLKLFAQVASHAFFFLAEELSFVINRSLARRGAQVTERDRTIVIVGASFAGHHVSRLVAGQLSGKSRYRVVVIEPNSHFQFTWVLPRFCVVKGHEHKAFIPYGNFVKCRPGVLEWIQDRVVSVDETHVHLQKGPDAIKYDYLVIATGSGVRAGLPSRVNATEKRVGVVMMRDVQSSIEKAATVVVAGGGAAGVEIAADAKELYPDKRVVLVHSRSAVMHRFGTRLQEEALEGLLKLGVDVVLEDRVVDTTTDKATLRSGREISCDFLLNCTGQAPCSDLIASLSPSSISPSGYIKVKPTLQIADDKFPNIYACGEVADTETPSPNARSATRQAVHVAKNLLQALDDKPPKHEYKHHFIDTSIKLTLGLRRTVFFMGEGGRDLLSRTKEKNDTMSINWSWARLGQKAFQDDEYDRKTAEAKHAQDEADQV